MKKWLLIIAFVLSAAICAAGCGSGSGAGSGADAGGKGAGSGAGSKQYLELINKIEVGDSLEKINEIIGAEGEAESDNATYTWDIDGGGGFSAIFRANDTSAALSVKLLYNDKDVADNKVVVKNLDDLKAKVSEGINYDDFKEIMGGVDGILISKNSVAKGYVWRNAKGSVVNASFTLDDNMCNNFVGTEK